VNEIIAEAARRLAAAGVDSPRLEVRLLLARALGIASVDVVGDRFSLDVASEARFLAFVERRIAREPLAYIVGRREFWSLDFCVGPGVLVPRPESETLVEEALRIFDDPKADLAVLDLGTGSGCLLLAFLSERPNACGVGIDTSVEALHYARANAAQLGLADRATFEDHDWAAGVAGAFDVAFVNPPYLTESELAEAPSELRVEPHAALAGGPDGLDAYRALAPHLAPALSPDGHAFVEIGRGQADAVVRIFSLAGLETVKLVPDLSNIPRCLVLAAALPDGQKGIGKAKKNG